MAPIHGAAMDGDLQELNRLLEQDPRRLNEQNSVDMSPLMLAACNGHDAVLARLLALGADTTLQIDQGLMAVHMACMNSRAAALALLIDAGTPLNACSNNGITPLMKAVYYNAPGCVALLLSRGGDALELDAADALNGWTALHHAAWNQQPEILRLLLDAGAHPAIPNNCGLTPLYIARRKPNNPCTPLLEAAIVPSLNARLLLKARALADAGCAVHSSQANALTQSSDPEAQQKAAAVAAASACLKRRVERGQEMPAVEVNEANENEELGACVRFVLGLQGHGGWAGPEPVEGSSGGGGMSSKGLYREVFVELMELLVPAWDRASV